MSIRSWQAEASHQVELEGKVWPVVTQDDLCKALLDGAVVLDRAGGCLQVVLQRQPTGLPNEYLTVAAIVVWQDRTNAKAQPESTGLEIVAPAAMETEPPPEPAPNGDAELGEQELAAVAALTDSPDVDESAVPPELRGS